MFRSRLAGIVTRRTLVQQAFQCLGCEEGHFDYSRKSWKLDGFSVDPALELVSEAAHDKACAAFADFSPRRASHGSSPGAHIEGGRIGEPAPRPDRGTRISKPFTPGAAHGSYPGSRIRGQRIGEPAPRADPATRISKPFTPEGCAWITPWISYQRPAHRRACTVL